MSTSLHIILWDAESRDNARNVCFPVIDPSQLVSSEGLPTVTSFYSQLCNSFVLFCESNLSVQLCFRWYWLCGKFFFKKSRWALCACSTVLSSISLWYSMVLMLPSFVMDSWTSRIDIFSLLKLNASNRLRLLEFRHLRKEVKSSGVLSQMSRMSSIYLYPCHYNMWWRYINDILLIWDSTPEFPLHPPPRNGLAFDGAHVVPITTPCNEVLSYKPILDS